MKWKSAQRYDDNKNAFQIHQKVTYFVLPLKPGCRQYHQPSTLITGDIAINIAKAFGQYIFCLCQMRIKPRILENQGGYMVRVNSVLSGFRYLHSCSCQTVNKPCSPFGTYVISCAFTALDEMTFLTFNNTNDKISLLLINRKSTLCSWNINTFRVLKSLGNS